MLSRILVPVCLILAGWASTVSASSLPHSMSQTKAVHVDLVRLKSECDRAINMTRQLRSSVNSTRKGVEQSIDVTRAIKSMDERLKKLIDQLKPYDAVPKVRTVTKTLSKNLKRVHSQLHSLRIRTDRCRTNVLEPSRDKLRNAEASLLGAERKLSEMRSVASLWMTNLSQAAWQANQVDFTRQAFELSCRSFRPITRTAADTVVSVRTHAQSVGYKLNGVGANFAAFRTVGNSLNEMSRKMESGEKVAKNLDKVLLKKHRLKFPFGKKELVFTIREILEKPGKVVNFMMKPVEKLTDKLLDPVLAKMKLELKAPKGLADLNHRLSAVESAERNLRAALGQLLNKIENDLTRQLRDLKSRVHQPMEIVRQAKARIPAKKPIKKVIVEKEPVKRVVKPVKRNREFPAMFLISG